MSQQQESQSQHLHHSLSCVPYILPDYFAAWIAVSYGHPYYALIIASSTTMTLLWHVVSAPKAGVLGRARMATTAAWVAADTWLWPTTALLHLLVLLLRQTYPPTTCHLVNTLVTLFIAACV